MAKEIKKVIVIGVDAMSPDMVEKFVSEGKLPNIAFHKHPQKFLKNKSQNFKRFRQARRFKTNLMPALPDMPTPLPMNPT